MKAFPNAIREPMPDTDDGMDLRDYFAIRILQSQLRPLEDPSEAIKYAYDVADKMIGARK